MVSRDKIRCWLCKHRETIIEATTWATFALSVGAFGLALLCYLRVKYGG